MTNDDYPKLVGMVKELVQLTEKLYESLSSEVNELQKRVRALEANKVRGLEEAFDLVEEGHSIEEDVDQPYCPHCEAMWEREVKARQISAS